jgi:hypothetical protein
MTKVLLDVAMSLDGFVIGPDTDLERGPGRGGDVLRDWTIGRTTGAEDRMAFGGEARRLGAAADLRGHPRGTPARPGRVDFHPRPDGVATAIERARAAAGQRDVTVMGGGDVVRQCLDEGLADERRIHLAPVVLGGGTPLVVGLAGRPFRLEPISVVGSPAATPPRYRVVDGSRGVA